MIRLSKNEQIEQMLKKMTGAKKREKCLEFDGAVHFARNLQKLHVFDDFHFWHFLVRVTLVLIIISIIIITTKASCCAERLTMDASTPLQLVYLGGCFARCNDSALVPESMKQQALAVQEMITNYFGLASFWVGGLGGLQ